MAEEKRMVKRKIKFAQFVPFVGKLHRRDLKDDLLNIELHPQKNRIFNVQVEVTYEIEEEEEVKE